MPVALILTFLKDNWKLVLAVLAVLGLAGYIWFLKAEVNHYKSAAQEARAELAAAAVREEKLRLASEGIEKKYAAALVETKKTIELNAKLIEEAIQHDKELATLRVSYNAIGLYNASKRTPSAPAPKAVKGDDGKAGTADPSGTANGVRVNDGIPLTVVWKNVAQNDANHWKCVRQVEAWQGFYLELSAAWDQASRETGK